MEEQYSTMQKACDFSINERIFSWHVALARINIETVCMLCVLWLFYVYSSVKTVLIVYYMYLQLCITLLLI